jgi:hypothetical protein
MFILSKIPVDFIPPQPKNPLACIVHQLALINKNDEILPIPCDPRITIETLMEFYPDFFIKSYGRYTIYILDEYVIQRHVHKKTNKTVQRYMIDVLKKYISCGPQR